MYLYLYDTFLSDKKYDAVLARIEARLIELGIQGIIERCSILKNIDELILHGIKKGVNNVIAVGNDQTFSKVLKVVANKDVTLGFIPITQKSVFAKVLGIPLNDGACDVLSKRVIEQMDLGKIGKHYFFTSLRVCSKRALLECDGRYKVKINDCDDILICNMGHFSDEQQVNHKTVHNLMDGVLEAVIEHTPQKLGWLSFGGKQKAVQKSVIPIKKVKIFSEQEAVEVIADNSIVLKTPVTVEVVPRKLAMIVGKDRLFS